MAGRDPGLGGLMGYGDNLMATGLARGAGARGKKIAFGDGRKIIWDQHSAEIFRANPNVARPGAERQAELEWVRFHKGHRIYNRQGPGRWIWNYEFTPTPGELYFDAAELKVAKRFGAGFVLIEPNVPAWKSCAPNKDWGVKNYQAVADRLRGEGLKVAQFARSDAPVLNGVERLTTKSFRDGVGVLRHARLYVGPEGGLHHGAAAMGIPAVVLFGGFIPPAVTGYPGHANLTGGAEACGSLNACPHCKAAMAAISVDQVVAAALERI